LTFAPALGVESLLNAPTTVAVTINQTEKAKFQQIQVPPRRPACFKSCHPTAKRRALSMQPPKSRQVMVPFLYFCLHHGQLVERKPRLAGPHDYAPSGDHSNSFLCFPPN
jgi:hypothetical protein